MTPNQKTIYERFKSPQQNNEFLDLWNSCFDQANQALSANINKSSNLTKLLNENDGSEGHPTGLSGLFLTRSFQASTGKKGAELPALEFSVDIHALLPVSCEHPWATNGWLLFHRVASGVVSAHEQKQVAVRLWLLNKLKVRVFRTFAVYLDTKNYRLASSQMLEMELFRTHGGVYDFHAEVMKQLHELEGQITAAEAQAAADFPSASKQALNTKIEYYRFRCLQDFMRKPTSTNSSETNESGTLHELMNDQEKHWTKHSYLSANTPLVQIEESVAKQLNTGHQLQITAAKTNAIAWIEDGKDRLRQWLSGATNYPLYFFDLETYCPRLPIWSGTKINKAVPFQFSLHVQETEEGPAKHKEFIHEEATDPRLAFADALMEAIPNSEKGCLLIYTQYEIETLDELLASLQADNSVDPDRVVRFETWWNRWKPRIVDLHEPFYKANKNDGFEAWLYHPDQRGSTSIKKVVPAFTGTDPYAELEIQDGLTASDRYVESIFGNGSADKNKCLTDLKAYCKVDTEVMVNLWAELKGLVQTD